MDKAQQSFTTHAQLPSDAKENEGSVLEYDEVSDDDVDDVDEEAVKTKKSRKNAAKTARVPHPYDCLSSAMESKLQFGLLPLVQRLIFNPEIKKFQEVCSITNKGYKIGRATTRDVKLYSLELAGGDKVSILDDVS